MLIVAFATVVLVGSPDPSGGAPAVHPSHGADHAGGHLVPVLKYIEPRAYEFGYEVGFLLGAPCEHDPYGEVQLRTPVNGDVMMPGLMEGPNHLVDEQTVRLGVWNGMGREISPLPRVLRQDQLFGAKCATATLQQMPMVGMRWRTGFSVQVWNLVFDEAAAQQVTWPREWPDDVNDGLAPQFAIESLDPIFTETVERVTDGQLRMVAPHMAAKALVRFALNNIRVVEPGQLCYERLAWREAVMRQVRRDGELVWEETGRTVLRIKFEPHDEPEMNRALMISSAARAASSGVATQADLVAVCVALLRAADIPARPVIGVVKSDRIGEHLICWGEYYLSKAGWVPFDPRQLSRSALVSLS